MSIPLSAASYPGAGQVEYNEAIELIDDIAAVLATSADPKDVFTQAKGYSGDSAALAERQRSNLISEQLVPELGLSNEQLLIEAVKTQVKASQEQEALQQQATATDSEAVEDKNITANYLFSLNPLHQVRSDMEKTSAKREKRGDSREHDELLRFIRAEKRDAAQDDHEGGNEPQEQDLAPMIEAMVNELPQIEMALPGGVTLRLVMQRDGRVNVMYVTPDGNLRTLPKGKTLRLDRWVNGVTLRTDGTIAFTP